MPADSDLDSRRPIGRPKATEPHSTVSCWLSPRDHDKLIALAKRHETSVSATLRVLLRACLRERHD